ncbi:hypothetical protein [Burkholderia gladioli]|uniref:hypothetical protein n=1 Tax=Burkholderia gladioli TaxID=28095 RepID=UPI001C23468D|nr:hypothetical protein [Burkholderia gladioli]MBU9169253.1 hypothetical protein [Burkholderia gladioli]
MDRDRLWGRCHAIIVRAKRAIAELRESQAAAPQANAADERTHNACCPFCDSDDFHIDSALGKRQTLCNSCEAAGPTEETDEEAIASFTRMRASQAAAPQANAAEESEDAYVIRRLSETLADVAVTLRGDDPVHPDDPLNKIELVKRLAEVLRMEVELYRAQAAAPAEAREPKLTVWYGSMPESNGKTNWTAILHRGDIATGMTIDRSEYPDRVRYEADRVRWLIGEIEAEPWILDYDTDKHSGYKAPADAGDAVAHEDTARLDFIANESVDLVCFEFAKFEDADIGWRVLEHHMREPEPRVIGEVYRDDPRAAIDAARAQGAQGGKGGDRG